MASKHLRDCARLCRAAGLSVLGVEFGGKHVRFRCEEGVMILPSTPSDRRWGRNAAAQARRMKRDAG
ncbi:hypothetical protein [Stagnihabitans tardus]|uniref:Uncharacterized protein n=1 Tax=Stagnihabitans tardus TaxID=2699202 RepID=A0AAE5BTU0_9RHOB|nr:hypothetical protein [Stagnihabitans tardus]NBZ86059.1 hypothetical protein [Stagnihabitans tardus]